MSEREKITEEVFPKGSGKSYALVEWMRRDSPMVGKGPDGTVFSFPIVLLWETILLLGTTFIIFLFSLLKQAPLDEIANPLVTTDPAKAPWYFVGLQELLEHMHPTLAGVIIPTVLVLFLLAIPYMDTSQEGAGIWFTAPRGKRIVGWTFTYTVLVMPVYITLDNAFPPRELLRDVVPQWVAQGLIPILVLGLIVALPVLFLSAKKAGRREILLALFTVMFASAIVFTISGFLFRGPGFNLYWPWEMPSGYNPWADL